MLVDSHCHLDFNAFEQDRESTIERARQSGVGAILNPGVDLASSKEAVRLSECYPAVYAAVGVHPNEAKSWCADTADEIRELVKHSKVVAIGEIGLDYYRDRAPKEVQLDVFCKQLDIAAECKLPIIIHTRDNNAGQRDATRDILDILADWHVHLIASHSPLAERPGVLHSFSSDKISAERFLGINFFIGITGPVTFNKAVELQGLVKSIPLQQMLIETDSPFLTPHPYRGQRNEPAYVVYIAEKISKIQDVGFDEIAKITTSNAERLFHWQAIH